MKNILKIFAILLFAFPSISNGYWKACKSAEKAKASFLHECKVMAAGKIAFSHTITGEKVESDIAKQVQTFCECFATELKDLRKYAEYDDCEISAQETLTMIDPEDDPGRKISKKCPTNPANK